MELNIEINEKSLKVERVTAKAMIEGFRKGNDKYHVSIYTAHKDSTSLKSNFENMPKLFTHQSGKPSDDYPISKIGDDLNWGNYDYDYKYIVILDTIYEINIEFTPWKEICNNGLFDIWDPKAPYNSLIKKGTGVQKINPKILLLRIFEIDRSFTNSVNSFSAVYHQINDDVDRNVKLISPIIANDKFDEIKRKLDQILLHNSRKKSINDTNQYFSNDSIINSNNLSGTNDKTEYADTVEEIIKLEKEMQNKPLEVKEAMSKRIERGKITNEVKKMTYYKCLICEKMNFDPICFIKRNNTAYVEAHHVIEVSNMEEGVLSISNIITVCPNHHRQLHYGKTKLIEDTDDYFIFEIDNVQYQINKIKIPN